MACSKIPLLACSTFIALMASTAASAGNVFGSVSTTNDAYQISQYDGVGPNYENWLDAPGTRVIENGVQTDDASSPPLDFAIDRMDGDSLAGISANYYDGKFGAYASNGGTASAGMMDRLQFGMAYGPGWIDIPVTLVLGLQTSSEDFYSVLLEGSFLSDVTFAGGATGNLMQTGWDAVADRSEGDGTYPPDVVGSGSWGEIGYQFLSIDTIITLEDLDSALAGEVSLLLTVESIAGTETDFSDTATIELYVPEWVTVTGADGSTPSWVLFGAEVPVPEPSTWLTMVSGFGLLGGFMRKRRTWVGLRTTRAL